MRWQSDGLLLFGYEKYHNFSVGEGSLNPINVRI